MLCAGLLLFIGCATLQQLAQSAFVQPTFSFKTVNLRDISLTGLTLDVVYHLDNPNTVGLDLAKVDYALSVEGRSVVSGSPPNGLAIPASGGADVTFPATLRFADLAPLVEVFLSKDSASYHATGSLGVNTPVGLIFLPLQHDGVFEVPKIPSIQLQSPRIKSVGLSGASLKLPLTLISRNSYDLPIAGVLGVLNVSGAKVASISTGDLGVLTAKGTRSVTLPLSLDMAHAAQAVLALKSGPTPVKLQGQIQSGAGSVPFELLQTLTAQ